MVKSASEPGMIAPFLGYRPYCPISNAPYVRHATYELGGVCACHLDEALRADPTSLHAARVQQREPRLDAWYTIRHEPELALLFLHDLR